MANFFYNYSYSSNKEVSESTSTTTYFLPNFFQWLQQFRSEERLSNCPTPYPQSATVCFNGFAAVSPLPPPPAAVQLPPPQQVPLPPSFQAEPAPTSLTKNMPPSSGGGSGRAARAAAAWYRPADGGDELRLSLFLRQRERTAHAFG